MFNYTLGKPNYRLGPTVESLFKKSASFMGVTVVTAPDPLRDTVGVWFKAVGRKTGHLHTRKLTLSHEDYLSGDYSPFVSELTELLISCAAASYEVHLKDAVPFTREDAFKLV